MSDNSLIKEDTKFEKVLNLQNDFPPPTYEEWRTVAEGSLKGASFEKALVTPTYEGINLQPIYCKKDIAHLPHLEEKPGSGYYSRGTKIEGFPGHSWEICQALKYCLPEEFNQALKHDLQKGQNAVYLVPDTATRMGLDANEAEMNHVGADGVSLSTLDDVAAALKDINLEKYPIYMEAGCNGLPMLAALAALLQRQNESLGKVKGSINTDPLGFLAANGYLPAPWQELCAKMAAVTGWAAANMPMLKAIGISGIPYHNAGANAVQELGFVLASAVEYIDRLLEEGLTIDQIAGNMRFTFAVGSFFFMETAKLRAARMLWTRIVEAYGGSKESQKMTIHGVTSFYNQTQYDPYVNMLRTTTETFSAVIGGVDSLQTNPFDESLGIPDEFSRRVARNTQIVLNEESHLGQLIDPAGGSYYVEHLTAEVAQKAWALFQEIEKRGGMFKALQDGFPQSEIETVAELRKKDLAKRKAVIVGMNTFADVKENKLAARKPDQAYIYNLRKEQLKEYKNNIKDETLAKVHEGKGNEIIETAIEILAAGGTLGMLSGVSKTEKAPITIKPFHFHRAAEMFEELRDAVAAFETKTGAKPKLFLATMGPLAQHKARADFSRGFFEVGGFDVIYPAGFATSQAAVDAALESKAPVVVICSTDETYPELVPAITRGLKEKNPAVKVVLAGFPKDQVEAHKQTGVDAFIYLGADVAAILSDLLKNIGVL
ncbi:MAG: acyl-CoA mutase large subunit family protein [Acidobacteria bacterium]|jgi:methylmalonyl-CoA mutase|nr:acyl-CoA mutase large subunit family protein [Acidobacteriota bacterium]